MDYEYSHIVDFNGVLHQVMAKIMSPKAKPLKPYFNLLRPFPIFVWTPIFAVLFISVLVYPILTTPFSEDPFWSRAIRDGLIIYGLTFYQSTYANFEHNLKHRREMNLEFRSTKFDSLLSEAYEKEIGDRWYINDHRAMGQAIKSNQKCHFFS